MKDWMVRACSMDWGWEYCTEKADLGSDERIILI
jgi:hypothetical protein